jgi:uncharacterized protein (TIGR01777 family)
LDKNILITGGTGLIGQELTQLLIAKKYNVAILSRSMKSKEIKSYYWDYEKEILNEDAIEFADVIIHLAGENVSSRRWTKDQKLRILESRVKTANLLFSKSKEARNKPKMFISASAVGFYGMESSDRVFTEGDNPGNDFLAETAVYWEKGAEQFESIGIQTGILRIGVVLSKKGGALKKMMKPVKLGMAAALGTGNQFMPWIEISDLARMFLFVMENHHSDSIYNAVAPNHINNYNFMKTLSRALKRPFFLPNVPSFVLRLFFGEMSDIILKGNKVSSEKVQKAGFDFRFEQLEEVLRSVVE